MMFELTEDQAMIRDLTERVCRDFDDRFWRELDETGTFPEGFYRAVAKAGLLGVAMPKEFGGSGLGIGAAAVMMEAIAASGAGMAGASSVHMNIFGLQPVVAFGSVSQKQRMLPPIIRGEEKACFAVTEPDAGLNTTEIKLAARKDGDRYILTGQKIWTSTAQVADRVLVLARTTPRDQVEKKTRGMSLFYTKLDRDHVTVDKIAKMGRHAVDSNVVFFDDLPIPEDDLIGEEGDGFSILLHGLNPERVLVAAEAIGLGRAALRAASDYARERHVFGRPIGMNQGIQHPLAQCWMNLEAAWLMALKAAARFDRQEPCGTEANSAKYLAAEAAFRACETAIQTLGGMGYAKEYNVERYLREAFIPRIAPVSPQMILNYIAEKVLGLPKSY
jgi:acyl-CoA dehydrogenase